MTSKNHAGRACRAPGAAAWAALLALSPASSLAQNRSVVALPQLDRTAQSYAIGDGGAVLQGLNSLGINPAGLHTQHPELLTQYQQLPLQTQLALLAASYPLRRLNSTLALSYLNLKSSSFDRRNELGDKTGDFATQDQMFGLHFSRPIPFPNPISLGASIKLLQMKIDSNKAAALAFDLGGRYQLPSLPLAIGLSAVNLGRGPSFQDQESKLPSAYILSGAWSLKSPLAVLASYTRHANEDRHEFNMGMQYSLGDAFSLRGRYAMVKNSAADSSPLQNLAAGVGFKLLRRHSLDYAFQPLDSSFQQAGVPGTHRVTLTFRFNNEPALNTAAAWQARLWDNADRADARTINDSLSPKRRDARRPAADSLAKEAFQALHDGSFALAALRFQQAADADPANAAMRSASARAKAAADILPNAQGSENPMPLLRRGVLLFVDGRDLRAALQLLRRAFDQDPSNDRALALLNLVERSSGLKEPSRRDAEDPRLGLLPAKLKAARQAAFDGLYHVSIKRCKEALDIEPNNVRALEILGSSYLLLGDKKNARNAWNRVLKLDPRNTAVARHMERI